MPSLGSHMARARTIASELRHPAIDADRGSYYFGSSAPDIRVITRRDRSETHFLLVILECFAQRRSVRRFTGRGESLHDVDAALALRLRERRTKLLGGAVLDGRERHRCRLDELVV